jgi:ATP phosphoribosyltransferase regulatory subunit
MSPEALPFIELEAGLEIKAALESDPRSSATGLTLFMDSILKAVPSGSNAKKFFVPTEMNTADKRRFRDEGWTILTGLSMVPDDPARACRLGCSNFAVNAKIIELS